LSTKTALITGVNGQDGSYLAELLLEKGYEVHGLIRRSSLFNTARIKHLFEEPYEQGKRFHLHYADLTDQGSMGRIIHKHQPTEIYNLGAQSHVKVSFDVPEYTADVVALGAIRLLEVLRESGVNARLYQASSSEMFGSTPPPQGENTPFRPRSPYAAAKIHAYWATVNHREAYGSFACNGILFNHESPRRGETFVTRKITRGLAQILAGQRSKLHLGNLDAKRDWGYAKDYVEGMWRMLQAEQPGDYVLATGESHSVREFLDLCCGFVGLNAADVCVVDPRYFRPTEVDHLQGDSSKARKVLGWKPTVGFEGLARLMLAADMEAVGLDPTAHGLEPVADQAVVMGESDR
jgi:GDPmannose 4,6-dehydratase